MLPLSSSASCTTAWSSPFVVCSVLVFSFSSYVDSPLLCCSCWFQSVFFKPCLLCVYFMLWLRTNRQSLLFYSSIALFWPAPEPEYRWNKNCFTRYTCSFAPYFFCFCLFFALLSTHYSAEALHHIQLCWNMYVQFLFCCCIISTLLLLLSLPFLFTCMYYTQASKAIPPTIWNPSQNSILS